MEIADGRSSLTNRVLITNNQSMMGAGLEHLLSGEQALDVFGVEAPSEEALLEKIRQIQPDVVILDAASPVTNVCRLLEALGDYGRLRVIKISAENNDLDVYDKKRIAVQNQNSLLSQLKPE